MESFLSAVAVNKLPGVGPALTEKLKRHDVATIDQLRVKSKEFLQREFGKKTGEMLYDAARGVDHRTLKTEFVSVLGCYYLIYTRRENLWALKLVGV